MFELIMRVIVLVVTIGVGVALLIESVPLILVRPILGIFLSCFFLFVMYWVTRNTWIYLKNG